MFDSGNRRIRLEGRIAAAGFPSGDRFVIGLWDRGPLGPMLDVMWASDVREWYRIDAYRPAIAATASLDGRDLGALAPLDPPAHFGFSEFPTRPAIVDCAPLLEGAEAYLPYSETRPNLSS